MMADPDTIHTIYVSLRTRLARAVMRIVPPKEVEDIVQETYVRVCQADRIDRIRTPRSSGSSRLGASIAREAADRHRRRGSAIQTSTLGIYRDAPDLATESAGTRGCCIDGPRIECSLAERKACHANYVSRDQ